jgi:coenzyme Q-binding protein COQ10
LRHQLTRVLPYTPEQLFELVGDVERYPEFVPHLHRVRVWDRAPERDGVSTLKAEAVVGYGIIRERFSTSVYRDRTRHEVQVRLLSGPFHHLENRWGFTAAEEGASVEFMIDFALKSRILDAVVAANFERAMSRLVSGFSARAEALYGRPPETGRA